MNLHVYEFSCSSHNPLPTAHHLCWLGPPVFVMAVGKQWRGDALFSLSPFLPLWFLLLWRRLTNYYRSLQSAKPRACGHTGILNRYKSITSLSLQHEPHCCEAGHRAGARADSHTGCCPAYAHTIPHRSHYWPAVALIAPTKTTTRHQHNTRYAHFNTSVTPAEFVMHSRGWRRKYSNSPLRSKQQSFNVKLLGYK